MLGFERPPSEGWNVRHHFPFLELQANIRRNGWNVPLGFFSFFGQEIGAMNPLAAPVWLAGLWFFLFAEQGKRFRALGWAWVFTAGVIVTMSPRVYYLFPAFPLLFAAGSVMWEGFLEARHRRWRRVAYPALLIAAGAILAPLVTPVLPVETYIRYTRALHLSPPASETRSDSEAHVQSVSLVR